MARPTKRLNARLVASLVEPGMHADGDGLYLVVTESGAKRWTFIFQFDGKRKELGLGRFPDISLAEARERTTDARKLVASGTNPIDARKAAKGAAQALDYTFTTFATEIVDALAHGFRNEKHIAQWRMTLDTYCGPIRSKRLDQIDTADVLAVLQPIWTEKNETASRLRGRIERILDAAKAKGLRSGENPARWRGHLDTLLPKRQQLQRGHHAAMHYGDVPKFLEALADRDGIAARALEWTILSAARSGETMGACWSEVDLKNMVWTIPANRMKAGREHRVPITPRMAEILQKLKDSQGLGDFIFPGQKRGKPLSVMALAMQMRRMAKADFTVHGFRSAFRDWAAEETSFPREIAEAALAHVVGDATERAYRRGDALERRRELMSAWEKFLSPPDHATVIPIYRHKG